MSAPPGWHLQPDGRERWWDGQQWTEQFRDPLPNDPTAPPTEAYGQGDASGSADAGDHTQALGVDRTQQLPTQPPAGGADQGGYVPPTQPTYPSQPQYSYPTGGGGMPAPGYGSGSYPPPQKQGMSGAAKGCLIAAVAILVIAAIAVAGGIFLFRQAADEVNRQIETAVPSTVPTDLPTELPTDGTLPTDVPGFGGEPVEVGVGEGFSLPRATIAPGWSVEPGDFGSEVVGMTAEFDSAEALPLLFTMSFQGSGDSTETVCSAANDDEGVATREVTCIPIFGEVSDSDRVTITPAF